MRSFGFRTAGLVGGLVLMLAGCGGSGVEDPPNGAIRALNLAANQPEVAFLREERTVANLVYKGSSPFLSVDQDQYDFNVEVTPVGASDPDRIFSFSFNVQAETEYTFIITDFGSSVTVETLTQEPFSGDDAQTRFLHRANAAGPVDVYVEAPGSNIPGATAWGTASPGDTLDPRTQAPGDYVITLTEVGNPANVLFTSQTFALTAADDLLLVAADSVGGVSEPLSVLVLTNQATNSELFSDNAQSQVRIIHSAPPVGPVDVVFADDFAMPFAANVAPGTVTDYAAVDAGSPNLKITPAGNPGVLEVDEEFGALPGRFLTLLLTGEPGQVTGRISVDRPISYPGLARIQVLNGATGPGTAVNIYLVPPGTDVADVNATVPAVSQGATTDYRNFEAGDYELIVTTLTADEVIGGPTPVTLTNGGVYGAVVIDAATEPNVDIVLFDDFIP